MNLIVRQTLIIIVIQSISLCSISQECSIFYDDFETGTYSPTWTTGTAFSANGVTTTNVADGVYSIEGTNSGSRPHLGGYNPKNS